MRFVLIVWTFLSLGLLSASCQDKSALKITFSVADDVGKSIDGASIETDVFDRWQSGEGFGKESFTRYVLKTDTAGIAVLDASTSRAELVLISRKEGFYDQGTNFKSVSSQGGRWQPWNPTIKIEMKRVLNPIPLIAKKVCDDFSQHVPIPTTGTDAGFDLELGDWVAPYGTGKNADLKFRLDGKTADPSSHYDARLRVSFSNQGDGLVRYEPKIAILSKLRMPYLAQTDGYQPELIKRKARVAGASTGVTSGMDRLIDDSDAKEDYFLRVRTVMDGNGKIVSAHYAKVYGGFKWYPTGMIQFQYHFNPTANDRNLEFDVARNLLRVSDSQKVQDP